MIKVGHGAIIYQPVSIVDDNKHRTVIGKNCRIGQFTFIGARNLTMKEGAEICPCVVIAGGGDVTLREFSTINFHCTLIPSTFTTDGEYMNDVVPEKSISVRGSIDVGKGAYIGSNAVICVSKKHPHIHIGDHSVIGAMSYIDHNVEADTIVHPKITYETQKRRRVKNER
jgi:UDP-3-O-[3-hydroxymyristoyl] glucosamine N-acyltransferase